MLDDARTKSEDVGYCRASADIIRGRPPSYTYSPTTLAHYLRHLELKIDTHVSPAPGKRSHQFWVLCVFLFSTH